MIEHILRHGSLLSACSQRAKAGGGQGLYRSALRIEQGMLHGWTPLDPDPGGPSLVCLPVLATYKQTAL